MFRARHTGDVTGAEPIAVTIEVDAARAVSGLWHEPTDATALLVLGHGAGAGMHHPFMEAVAEGLAGRRVATLRFQFPFAETGARRSDPPALAQATVRAAVGFAARRAPSLTLFAGGKSFGGRMTSQAQAQAPMAGVRGLVFLGFPLHPAGCPATGRAAHLAGVAVPMLFVSGTRDALAEAALLRPAVAALGERATLVSIEAADHGLHVPARSGRTDEQALAEALDAIAAWTFSRAA